MPDPARPPVRVFYSYAHADERLLTRLRKGLAVARQQGLIKEWHDRQMVPGQEWDREISSHLEAADLVVFLISPDFLASVYIYEKEMARAVERHDAGKGWVVPVFLRDCAWKGAPFGKIQAVPDDAHALMGPKWNGKRDTGFREAAEGIVRAVTHLRERDATPASSPPSPPDPAPAADALPPPVPVFAGREAEMETVRRTLNRKKRVALYGMGGVGKTQLALKYAEERATDYPLGVHVLRAETAATLGEDAVALAERLGLPEAAGGVVAAPPAFKRWLETHDGVLVLVDNAENRAAVAAVLPERGGAHVLVTTQNPATWRPHAEPVEVPTWKPDVGAAFLLERTGCTETATDAEREAARSLAEEMGGLPLALEQAAAYVDAKALTFAEYLTRFRDFPDDLLDLRSEGTAYPRSVVKTLGLAVERLEADMRAAVQLLQLCAFFAPDDIPSWLIRAARVTWPEPLETARSHPLVWDETIGALHSFSLVRVEGDRFSVHRLVQTAVRAWMSPQERSRTISSISDVLISGYESGGMPYSMYDSLVAHLLTVGGYDEMDDDKSLAIMHVVEEISLLTGGTGIPKSQGHESLSRHSHE